MAAGMHNMATQHRHGRSPRRLHLEDQTSSCIYVHWCARRLFRARVTAEGPAHLRLVDVLDRLLAEADVSPRIEISECNLVPATPRSFFAAPRGASGNVSAGPSRYDEPTGPHWPRVLGLATFRCACAFGSPLSPLAAGTRSSPDQTSRPGRRDGAAMQFRSFFKRMPSMEHLAWNVGAAKR